MARAPAARNSTRAARAHCWPEAGNAVPTRRVWSACFWRHRRRVAWSRLGPHFAHVEGLGAFAAHDDGVHVVIARGVVEDQGSPLRAGEPTIAPRSHGRQDRVDVPAFLGEAVLVAGRVLLVLDPLQQALVHEAAQALREDVAPDAELALEVV